MSPTSPPPGPGWEPHPILSFHYKLEISATHHLAVLTQKKKLPELTRYGACFPRRWPAAFPSGTPRPFRFLLPLASLASGPSREVSSGRGAVRLERPVSAGRRRELCAGCSCSPASVGRWCCAVAVCPFSFHARGGLGVFSHLPPLYFVGWERHLRKGTCPSWR